ncbi:MAG: 50S ribosomal protein L19 [Bdellovibrionales bacterium CG12_big_fil_rev_8_21_14_0_65_38_15]|nr:MAG: 50S ribosomal protein L19 [Bdellovibrionales bacterium CG22_combo_CG10-13_8_21_14_all_38_13]PIQ54347.1 MAG: 50S ribosomal protein L19 [Bdellovibrionales bacterium CG12_big_fil_rev_8_21_14_0_65_38_15]PIR28302.1 MAG: 50S ribosomal protein L19 [Bdellovibrionales bacterium CG11_big_fil_rev_8_21_14_0_20_38_13]
MNLIDIVNQDHLSPRVAEFPKFRTGDTIAVHSRIKEGDKSRIQIFEGVCIALKEAGTLNGHFRVRKMSSGMGVERVFPFHSPNVEKIEVVQRGKARKAKLYYLRERSGKSARIAIDYDRGDKA